ncbi:MAG: tRNA epoxyqueuosine(34) reductase QueG [Chitinophagales bacterium]|nr:tRNA epoxyqueuosine(34) reductase QueG [Chitinophagales bacterium]
MLGIKENLRQWALELGFQDVGFAQAGFLSEEAPLLENWLKQGYHGQMKYMENWFDKRLDPRLLVDGAKTVMVMTYNYHQEEKQRCSNAPKISQYAYSLDYHDVIRDKLNLLLNNAREKFGDFQARGFVDSAPVLENAWAKRAGIGWIGKHTLIINKRKGSFFFLASIVMDLKVEEDPPFKTDHCGTCTRCIDFCPTEAILAPGLLDASKCISYLTIELKDAIPDSFKGKTDGWVFGCDICQEVCPWNRFSITNHEPAFKPSEEFLNMTQRDWEEMTQETFSRVFRKSAVKRTKYAGLMRNIKFLKEND